MAFDSKYLLFGKITYTSCSVSVWSDAFHARNLPNVPQTVRRAYWQYQHIVVETETGWAYIYEDFTNYSKSYRP